VRDGDIIRLDSIAGTLEARVPQDDWAQRELPQPQLSAGAHGLGRELFGTFRAVAGDAESGALSCLA
jgi:phosphogluconate dehydratase